MTYTPRHAGTHKVSPSALKFRLHLTFLLLSGIVAAAAVALNFTSPEVAAFGPVLPLMGQEVVDFFKGL